MTSNKKTALNLIGGGAKGIRTAGAVKYLQERSFVPFKVFAQSSGGLNAFMYAQGQVPELELMWFNIRNKDVKNFRPWYLFGPKASLYDFTPLRATIAKMFRPDLIKASKWDTEIGVTNLSFQSTQRFALTGASTDVDILLASASIPVYVPPINGNLVDGGVSDNCGIEAAIMAGCTRIIVIHPDMPKPFVGYSNVLSAIETVITMLGWATYQAEKQRLGFIRQTHKVEIARVSLDAEITTNHEIATYKTTRKLACESVNLYRDGIRSLIEDNAEIELIEIIPNLDQTVSIFDFDYDPKKRPALIQSGYNAAKAALESTEL